MPLSPLDTIRLILVEPSGPLNVGSVARVMKNMGLTHLVLVAPHCDHLGTEARQMAVHAGEVLERARVVQSLPEALKGCRKAIATTGRPHHLTHPLENPRVALPWLFQDSLEPDSAALIFGPEDRGLNNQELNQAHRLVYIPSSPVYPSLNLAQAVGICCYEMYQGVDSGQWTVDSGERKEGRSREREGAGGQGSRGEVNSRQWAVDSGQWMVDSEEIAAQDHQSSPTPSLTYPPTPSSLAPLDQTEGFYQQLESLLLDIGYLYPHTANSRMQKFRRLFNRARLEEEEVALLRGVLSQVRWAIKQGRSQD